MPTVSIIIAAYNAAATIERAVASALGEAEAGEIIIVDDASPDQTVNAARAADDGTGRLKIMLQPSNAGPAAARNQALSVCTGEWIGILDADDFFLPGRLGRMLHQAGEAELLADDMWQVDAAAIEGPRRRLLQPPLSRPKQIGFQEFVLANITQAGRQRAELGFIKPLIRRAFLQEHGLRYQEQLRLGEDFELYARALGLGARLLLLPEPGYVSVVRASSLSGEHSEKDLQNLRDSDLRLMHDLNLPAADRVALDRHGRSIDCRLQWRLLILAVKQRDWRAGFSTFRRPWPVPAYLLGQLLYQVYWRSVGRLVKANHE